MHEKELHIVMAAQGSMFKAEQTSRHPAGIIDIAPTILHALRLPQPEGSDGRVLTEALADSDGQPPEAKTSIHTVERNGAVQCLKYTQVGSTTYLDAGWVE